MTMTAWAEAIRLISNEMSKKYICTVIKAQCLCSHRKYYGTYLVNDEDVWKYVIESHPLTKKRMTEKGIHDQIDLEHFYEETLYHRMWSLSRTNYRKTKR